jgi:hypothetical protein
MEPASKAPALFRLVSALSTYIAFLLCGTTLGRAVILSRGEGLNLDSSTYLMQAAIFMTVLFAGYFLTRWQERSMLGRPSHSHVLLSAANFVIIWALLQI